LRRSEWGSPRRRKNRERSRTSSPIGIPFVRRSIAGIYYSYPPTERFTTALPIIDTWLRAVYSPLIEHFYNTMSKFHRAIITMSRGSPTSGNTSSSDVIAQNASILLKQACEKRGYGLEMTMSKVDAMGLDELMVALPTRDKVLPSGLPQWTMATVRVELGGGKEVVVRCTRFFRRTAQDGAAYEAAVRLGIIQVSPEAWGARAAFG
jgi:hypothetical protein